MISMHLNFLPSNKVKETLAGSPAHTDQSRLMLLSHTFCYTAHTSLQHHAWKINPPLHIKNSAECQGIIHTYTFCKKHAWVLSMQWLTAADCTNQSLSGLLRYCRFITANLVRILFNTLAQIIRKILRCCWSNVLLKGQRTQDESDFVYVPCSESVLCAAPRDGRVKSQRAFA